MIDIDEDQIGVNRLRKVSNRKKPDLKKEKQAKDPLACLRLLILSKGHGPFFFIDKMDYDKLDTDFLLKKGYLTVRKVEHLNKQEFLTFLIDYDLIYCKGTFYNSIVNQYGKRMNFYISREDRLLQKESSFLKEKEKISLSKRYNTSYKLRLVKDPKIRMNSLVYELDFKLISEKIGMEALRLHFCQDCRTYVESPIEELEAEYGFGCVITRMYHSSYKLDEKGLFIYDRHYFEFKKPSKGKYIHTCHICGMELSKRHGTKKIHTVKQCMHKLVREIHSDECTVSA